MNSFVKGFGGAMLAYVILLPLSIFAYRSVDNAALKALIALAPVLPIALGPCSHRSMRDPRSARGRPLPFSFLQVREKPSA